MFFYAQCLEGGLGVPADATAAREWYQKAATEGEPRAAAKLQKAAK
jgi:TPR repeat protein